MRVWPAEIISTVWLVATLLGKDTPRSLRTAFTHGRPAASGRAVVPPRAKTNSDSGGAKVPFCFVPSSCGVLFGLMVLFTAHSYLTNTFFSEGAAGVCGLTLQVRAGNLWVTFPLPSSVQPRAIVGLLPFPRNSASLGFVPWEVNGREQSLPQTLHERESL